MAGPPSYIGVGPVLCCGSASICSCLQLLPIMAAAFPMHPLQQQLLFCKCCFYWLLLQLLQINLSTAAAVVILCCSISTDVTASAATLQPLLLATAGPAAKVAFMADAATSAKISHRWQPHSVLHLVFTGILMLLVALPGHRAHGRPEQTFVCRFLLGQPGFFSGASWLRAWEQPADAVVHGEIS